MPVIRLPHTTVEDAMDRILAWVRNPQRDPFAVRPEPIASEFHLSQVLSGLFSEQIEAYRRTNQLRGMAQFEHDETTNVAPYHVALWELCRKGILRPAAIRPVDNPEPFGWRFAVTPYGEQWLGATSGSEVIPTAYGRFAELLAGHGSRFGGGYLSRSQEAIQCYQAHTYLACCVMCGAAAESILLALAIARTGDEARVLREYRTGSGRSRIENLLIGQQPDRTREALATYTELLKYWRDDAAHGTVVEIDEEEAFTALILLIRFARFADGRWDDLTRSSS
jgi:hypothetical protein